MPLRVVECEHPMFMTVDDSDGFRLDICVVCETEFSAISEGEE